MHSHKFVKLVSVDDNNKVTGFVFAEFGFVGGDLTRRRKLMHIHELGIDSSSRGTGFGTELMNEVKRIAKEKNCEEIILSVWAFNKKAIGFYIKNNLEVQTLRMEFKL